MTEPADDDITRLWLLARRVAAQLERSAEAELRAKLDLALPLYALLTTLNSTEHGVNQQEVAELLGLAKSSVSRQIEAAAKAGLVSVQTSTISRRENSVTLTESGRELVIEADAIVCALGPPSASAEVASASAALEAMLEAVKVGA
jgi:DNA-binding MarR family transcriptional regulator